ncbi:response regulator [Propionivibrio dicarboxylicus]|uniref:response regulator n=1 Tax=Propionivibrio dicarboxylicus TaxID=83767 RepID=UPI0024819FF4|nr:response regulator [Propionivibrio dicarboxylicus]
MDGWKAIQQTSEMDYAAILMDMQMPKMGGVEATQRIRELSNCRYTPILALTANAFSDHRAQYFAVGMNDFLTPPFQSKLRVAMRQNCLRRFKNRSTRFLAL